MDLFQIIVLSLIQGLTEFLPISSSAHLILFPKVTGLADQGLVFDIAVHVGTLAAVLYYFRQDLWPLISGWLLSIRGKGFNQHAKLAWAVILATIPVGLCGLLFKSMIESELRSTTVIAWATIIFGLLLWAADKMGKRQHSEFQLDWKSVLVIGLMQATALIPGASRSGVTMTAGLAMGLTRKAAARFSFLLSIPVIVLAGGLQILALLQKTATVPWGEIILAAGLSGISAYFCIHYFIKLLDKIGMLPFVIYRILLGVTLLLVF